ncbi:UNVERIFIED_CONTAM: hypothetical protein K2H54_015750, partial [Gekko kuhli]
MRREDAKDDKEIKEGRAALCPELDEQCKSDSLKTRPLKSSILSNICKDLKSKLTDVFGRDRRYNLRLAGLPERQEGRKGHDSRLEKFATQKNSSDYWTFQIAFLSTPTLSPFLFLIYPRMN